RNGTRRTLRNQKVQTWDTTGRPASGKRPGEGEVIGTSTSVGPIVRYQSYTTGADAEGNIDAMSLWAGQSVGLVSETQSAADIVREIAEQADRFFGDCHDDRCGSFVSFGSCAARASLDIDIQYSRQSRKRQRCRPDDGRAPGGVQGIQRAGKMHATLRGRAFARDHAITHDAESLSGAVTAGNRGRFERADRLGYLRQRGSHLYYFSGSDLGQQFHARRKRVVKETSMAGFHTIMI